MSRTLRTDIFPVGGDDDERERDQEGLVIIFQRRKAETRYPEQVKAVQEGCSAIGLQAFEWNDFFAQYIRTEGESRLLGPPDSLMREISMRELLQILSDCGRDVAFAGAAERNLFITVALVHAMLTMVVLTFFQTIPHFILWNILDLVVLLILFLFLLEIYNCKKYNKPFQMSLSGPARRYRNAIEERLANANARYPKLLFEYEWNWIQLSLGRMEVVAVRSRESIGDGDGDVATTDTDAPDQQSFLDQV